LILLKIAVNDFRRSWKELALTDIAYKIIAFIALAPLVGILFRILLSMSGKSVLADQDILFFFLGPAGWICFVVVGGIWLGIAALQLAALMGILLAASQRKRLGVIGALWFAAAAARPVILITARLLAFTLLSLLPFVAAIGLIYVTLLGEHDINFYLKTKPPVFWVAVGLAGLTVAALLALLLRLLSSWLFALPIVLFEDVNTSDVLRASRDRATGRRCTLLMWIAGWALAIVLLSTLASSLLVFVARLLIPNTIVSLWLLLTAIGATLILWSLVNLAFNLLGTTTFATLLFNLYRDIGCQGREINCRSNIDFSRLCNGADGGNLVSPRITTPRLLAVGVIGMIVAMTIGAVAIDSVQLQDKTQITAHRGASNAAPENTMAAVKQAIADGADWVEIDVQETADGQVVVFHDSDFMKLAGKKLKIWNATMDDLKDIDIGSHFAPQFNQERVPTLAAVLDECKGKIGVNIELKYYGHDKQLEKRVAQIVEQHGMASQVVIMSLKINAVKKMKALRPAWKVGLLMSVSAGGLKKINVDFLAVNADFVNRPFIRAAHNLNRQVHVWTVNDAATMSAMMTRGVDNIITDKPALAKSVLEQRADLNAPQRLLLELAGTLGVTPEIGEQ